MKAIGQHLFHMQRTGRASPVDAWQRVDARAAALNESWFRDAIFDNPELVISPCRAAGRVDLGETWLPWRTEHNFGTGPVDVLLVSSWGRIGIVETKLSYNPQKRREVVAQILDYALALQGEEFASLNLPPLPDDEAAPDIDDLRDAIEGGKFLLIVAGDMLDPRALRLSQALLGRNMTSAWDLAMIDLNVFESQDDPDRLLIVPELLGTVHAEVRHVEHVAVEGDSSRARVTVEHLDSEDDSPRRPPRIGSRGEFMDMVDPGRRELVGRILDRFQQVADASGGEIHWSFRAATANLYWRTPEGGSRRILTINRNSLFSVWLGYLIGQDYLREAEFVRKQAERLVQFEPGLQSARLFPDPDNIDAVLEVIGRVAEGLRAPSGD